MPRRFASDAGCRQQTARLYPASAPLMSISPAALSAFVGLQRPLGSALGAKMREGMALALSEVNGCGYCLSAHRYLATTFAIVTGRDCPQPPGALHRLETRHGDPLRKEVDRDARQGRRRAACSRAAMRDLRM